MNWHKADDIGKKIKEIARKLDLVHIDPQKIICFRSTGSSSRARARIWSFPKIWQIALDLTPRYCIEVLSEHFDHLSDDDQMRVLIHELLHIPQNFSGSLLPHRSRGKRIDQRRVEHLFKLFKNS